MKKIIFKHYWMYKLCQLPTISKNQFSELIFRIMDRDVWDYGDNNPKTILGCNQVRCNVPSNKYNVENVWREAPASFNIDTAYAVSITWLYSNGEYDILNEESKLFTFNTINELYLKLSVFDSKYENKIRDFTLYVQCEDKK